MDEFGMPKYEDAVTHTINNIPQNGIRYLVGSPDSLKTVKPLPPFDDETLLFLEDLSKELRKDCTSSFPDIASFAFWCRKSNLYRLKSAHACKGEFRLGRGRIFHIAPSNVPINFAFSFAFGLLAGCANTVRVSSKIFPQVEIVSEKISQILESGYPAIAAQNAIIQYDPNDEITRSLSLGADCRIIWGGDATIAKIRSFPLKPRGFDVSFADRVSLAVINEDAVASLPENELVLLAKQFYNDTYLIDQNACSSPHLVVWITHQGTLNGKESFWKAVAGEASRHYDFPPIKSIDKYTLLCENAIRFAESNAFEPFHGYNGNILLVVNLTALPIQLEALRGTCGLFYQFETPDLEPLAEHLNEKFQTIVTFGVDRKEIAKWVADSGIMGIDRVVPIGSALDIGTIWDGYDLVQTLTRTIQCS